EALTEWLLDQLRVTAHNPEPNRFLAIIGASGSGKSSLGRAGLVAAIQRGEIEGSSQWPVAICRPGHDPLESLATALCTCTTLGQSPTAFQELIAELQKNENMLHRTTRLALRQCVPECRLVLLVDQFEELFTLVQNEEHRKAFIGNLLYAAKVAQGQTVVLLTMRADF